METIPHNPLGPAPSLTVTAGSITEMVDDLDKSYMGMDSLASHMIATLQTNFEHGNIMTPEGKGDKILEEMIIGWKARYFRHRQDPPGEIVSSNSN